MKKLLILLLVLGVTSIALATPVMTAEKNTILVGETIKIYITGQAADATVLPNVSPGGFDGVLWTDYSDYVSTYYEDDPYLWIDMTNYTVENAAGGGSNVGADYDMANYGLSFLAAPTLHTGELEDPYMEADDVDAGLWFTFQVTGKAVGTTLLEMWDNFSSVEDSVSIAVIVPEPITIALLGLGGLFLRRRK